MINVSNNNNTRLPPLPRVKTPSTLSHSAATAAYGALPCRHPPAMIIKALFFVLFLAILPSTVTALDGITGDPSSDDYFKRSWNPSSNPTSVVPTSTEATHTTHTSSTASSPSTTDTTSSTTAPSTSTSASSPSSSTETTSSPSPTSPASSSTTSSSSPASPVTTTYWLTTTKPDGSKQVYTQVKVLHASSTPSPSPTSSRNSSKGGTPSLQNVASPVGIELGKYFTAVLGGAVVVAMML